MKKQTKRKRKLKPEEEAIILDKSIPLDVASMLLNMNKSEVDSYRQLAFYKEFRNKNQKRYYQERRQQELAKFGKKNASYRLWTEEEQRYIMTSTDTDEEMAEKLNRTLSAISSQRWLLKKEGRTFEEEKTEERKRRETKNN